MKLEEDVAEEENELEYFFLWDTKEKVFDIYKILRNYLSEYYGIDSAVLLALIKELDVPVTRTLHDIPFIHAGYLDIILQENSNGSDSRTES